VNYVQKWQVAIGTLAFANICVAIANRDWHSMLGWLVAVSYTVGVWMYEEKEKQSESP
jgi:hypothetical protein